MPAGYTHYQFSEDIIPLITDHHIKEIILHNKTLFQIGTHGPDIFFYHHFYNLKDAVCHLGRQMHKDKARDFFEQAMTVVKNDGQMAYILGFLCHYILDSQMHHHVSDIMKATHLSHFEIESEYDRYILKHKNIDPIHTYIYSHIQYNDKIVTTIQSFFPQLSFKQVKDSLHSMKVADRILTAPSYLKRGLLYGLFILSFHFHQLQGLIMNYHHNVKMEDYYDSLNQIYHNALKEASIYIPLYIDHIHTQASLPVRFDHNYK